jgi:hypothetical protein
LAHGTHLSHIPYETGAGNRRVARGPVHGETGAGKFFFLLYYIAPAPFTQGIFFIFIKFVNSVNILCKLRYVNSRNQERTPQESAAFFLDEILNLCENHSKNVKNQWFRIYRQDSH